jgi:hypothetical protein
MRLSSLNNSSGVGSGMALPCASVIDPVVTSRRRLGPHNLSSSERQLMIVIYRPLASGQESVWSRSMSGRQT